MKTLIFCAGAPNFNLSPINQPFDLLIGVDGGVQTLLAHGYTPDYVIGDFDSTTPPKNSQIIALQPEKADTDLEYALQYILTRYHKKEINKIIILGALDGGRLDHVLANFYLAYQPRFADFIEKFYFVEQDNTLRFYRSGNHILLREPNKRYLSFIGLTALTKLSLYDVKYPLVQHDFIQPTALISNEFLYDEMQFSFEQGLLAVIQSNDNKTSSNSLKKDFS